MSGIVLELQREALDETVSTESLLRKAYLVAKKLKLEEFEDWLSQEQNGYVGQIPEYRSIRGEIKAWNPYHGWIPVVMSGKYADEFTKVPEEMQIRQEETLARVIKFCRENPGKIYGSFQ